MSILRGSELLAVVDEAARAKEFSSNVILNALSDGMVQAYKKQYGLDKDIEVNIDAKTGEMKAFWVRKVVDIVEDINHVDLAYAIKLDSAASVGGVIKEDLPALKSSISITEIVRKSLFEKIKQIEKDKEYDLFKSREGDIVFCTVKSIDYRGNYIVSLQGGAEGIISKYDLLKTDNYRISDKLRAYIYKVESNLFKPQIFLSRSHNGMLLKLFELEIAHIYDKIITIEAIIRDPGFRSKIAVHSTDDNLDPVSICIGAKGSRIKNIMDELNGEKIDVVLWDRNITQFIYNSFKQGIVSDVVVDREQNNIEIIAFDEKDIKLIIGGKGQNVKFFSKASGMHIAVYSKQEYSDYQNKKSAKAIKLLEHSLSILKEQASILVKNGFSTLNSIKNAALQDLKALDNIGDIALSIQDNAKKALIVKAKNNYTQAEKLGIDIDLFTLLNDFCTLDNIELLVKNGIDSLYSFSKLSASKLKMLAQLDLSLNAMNSMLIKAKVILSSYKKEQEDTNAVVPRDENVNQVNENSDSGTSEDLNEHIHNEKNTSIDYNSDLTLSEIHSKIETIQNDIEDEKSNYVPLIENNKTQVQLDEPKVEESYAEVVNKKVSRKHPEKKEDQNFDFFEEEERSKTKPAKTKEEQKYKNANTLFSQEDDTEEATSKQKVRSIHQSKQQRKNTHQSTKIYREIELGQKDAGMSIEKIAHLMSEKSATVLKELKKIDSNITKNSILDLDTIELVAMSLGHTIKRKTSLKTIEDLFASIISNKDGGVLPRCPIVSIIGHVDHGKTTLIKALTKGNVLELEGITQKLSAHKIVYDDDKNITLLDTPGHKAFSHSRELAVSCSDIVVLLVAANDTIQEQAIETISHAQKYNKTVLVAVNKIDKSDSNISKVKNSLLEYGIVADDLGGETIIVPISAKQEKNLDKLLESILLLSEILDLKASVKGDVAGSILDSFVDKEKNVLTTLLIQQGHLKQGDIVVSNQGVGKVKNIKNDGYPGDVIDVIGIADIVGENRKFISVTDEKTAKDLVNNVKQGLKEEVLSMPEEGISQFDSFFDVKKQKQLNLILKTDAYSIIDVVFRTIETFKVSEVKVNLVFSSVGYVTSSDIALARNTGASILVFNTKVSDAIIKQAHAKGILIQAYNIIYDLFDGIKNMINDMADPVIEQKEIGSASVLKIFSIPKIGNILGCYVISGIIKRNAKVDISRNGSLVSSSSIKTLRREKDDASEVQKGLECGIALSNAFDVQEGDKIICFEQISVKPKII